MPNLTIPEEYIAGLAQLVALPDEAIHELTLALAESPASVDVRDATAVTSLISARVPTVPARDLRRIMAALLSLDSVRGSSDVPADEFLDDLVQAMRRSNRPEISLDRPEISRRFQGRLKVLLDLVSLATASKAVVIHHEPALRTRIEQRRSKGNGKKGETAPSAEEFAEAKRKRFALEAKGERVSRALVALNQSSTIELPLEEWRKIVEDSNFEDRSS